MFEFGASADLHVMVIGMQSFIFFGGIEVEWEKIRLIFSFFYSVFFFREVISCRCIVKLFPHHACTRIHLYFVRNVYDLG